LASSRAQLPHYIYVVFPLAAIITGKFLYALLYAEGGNNALARWQKPFFITQTIIFSLLGVVLFMLLYFPFPPVNWLIITAYAVLVVLVIAAVVKQWLPVPKLVALLALSIITINVLINQGFYRPLLQYQASIKVSEIVNTQHYNKNKFFQYKMDAGSSFDFYGNHLFVRINRTDTLGAGDFVLTSKQGLDSVDKAQFNILYTGQGFHVTKLTLPFLNPATRQTEIDPYYILQHR
jgi:hypothetical protein